MRTVAAIDCGTNSVKLLVAEIGADQSLTVLERTSEVVRLGQGVDATGALAPEALTRTFAALDTFAAILAERGIGPADTRFCATSATRDASNSAEFTAGVRARLGVEPLVLSGEQEAATGFAGATLLATPVPTDPVLTLDIGGGSTELVLGTVDGGPTASISMDIGSVRLHERHLRSDPDHPVSARQVAACLADIDAELDVAELVAGVDLAAAASLIGTSGTVKTIAASQLGLPVFDRDLLDGAELDVAETIEHCAELAAMSTAQRLAIPSMHPGRADVMDAGALVLSRILTRTTAPTLRVSEADLLYGIALC